MTRRTKQKWGDGDYFSIPLSDGSECLGRVLEKVPEALNSVFVALYETKGSRKHLIDAIEEGVGEAYSQLLTTRDQLNSGAWTVIGSAAPVMKSELACVEKMALDRYIGAEVRGSRLLRDFVEAFFGLAPWDDWYIDGYLDDFLASPEKKPTERLIYCGRHGKVI